MKKLILLASLLLLVACAVPPPTQSPLTVPIETNNPSPLTVAPSSPFPLETPPPQDQNGIAQQAVADLARRLSIDSKSIEVQQVVGDEFPAQGLGCAAQPNQGVSGDQPAFVTGLSIQLKTNEILYEYRSHGGELVYCGTVSP